MATLRDEYLSRHASSKTSAASLGRLHSWMGWVRSALSILFIITLVLASQGRLPASWVLLPAGTILGVYVAEVMLARRRDRARRKVALYAASLARVEERWAPVAFTGEEFFPPNHPSVFDLDLVGERSLFAWLNTARTRPGAGVLATWLTQPADETTLRLRRGAIEELRGRLDLREAICLAGQDGVARVDADRVGAWGRGSSKLPWLWMRWPLTLLAWGLVGTASGAALGWWGIVPVVTAGVGVILAHVALRARANAVVIEVIEPLHQLSIVSGIMAVLERQEFRAPLLRDLQGVLLRGGRASSAIRKLARVVNWLMELRVEMVALIGLPLLWPSRKALQIEAWRLSHGEQLGDWLEAVGTLEALLSIATYSDEHPTHIEAEVVPEGPTFQARALGHPLLPEASCVPNDVGLGGSAPSLLLLSGSNMSGKSTLLRAVGLNSAMALAGVPVRAAALRISRMNIAASIRTHDSVLDGESRFYAEIRHLKAIVDLSGGTIPVLFLLDELLSGTNSHDRLAGASGILSGLVARGAVGICSTHDLALTRIADELGMRAENSHFGDTLDDGRLKFDYKLKPGIVEHSNAIELMRAVGLEVRVPVRTGAPLPGEEA